MPLFISVPRARLVRVLPHCVWLEATVAARLEISFSPLDEKDSMTSS